MSKKLKFKKIFRVTDKAYGVIHKGKKVYIPKSQIKKKRPNYFIIPNWLYSKKKEEIREEQVEVDSEDKDSKEVNTEDKYSKKDEGKKQKTFNTLVLLILIFIAGAVYLFVFYEKPEDINKKAVDQVKKGKQVASVKDTLTREKPAKHKEEEEEVKPQKRIKEAKRTREPKSLKEIIKYRQPYLTKDIIKNDENIKFGIPGTTGVILPREGFVLDFNISKKGASWVSYNLDESELATNLYYYGFKRDPNLKSFSPDDDDYYNSGYHRGHLAPDRDMSYSKEALKQSYYYSNVCPQLRSFNLGEWKSLETKVRKIVNENEEAYIITGPAYLDIDNDGRKEPKEKIGDNKIWVPTHFYKIILYKVGGKYKTEAYLLPHKEEIRDFPFYKVPVDSIENVTDLNFLRELPSTVRKRVESTK